MFSLEKTEREAARSLLPPFPPRVDSKVAVAVAKPRNMENVSGLKNKKMRTAAGGRTDGRMKGGGGGGGRPPPGEFSLCAPVLQLRDDGDQVLEAKEVAAVQPLVHHAFPLEMSASGVGEIYHPHVHHRV